MDLAASIDKTTLLQLPIEELSALMKRYPYFQTLRFLYLKRLQQQSPEEFQRQLSIAAVYAVDRGALYGYVSEKDMLWHALQESRSVAENDTPDTPQAIDRFLSLYGKKEELAASHVLTYGATVDYLTTLFQEESCEDTTLPQEVPALAGIDLIDAFLEQAQHTPLGRGGASDSYPLEEIAVWTETRSSQELSDVSHILEDEKIAVIEPLPQPEGEEEPLSESLAKIYIAQKRYEKALDIIKKLSLKYPKKNIYFADQIRFLEKLIIHTKQS